ncbi:MAG: hypothetical protein JRK53_01815 [Deltaproteobacteria bacterium]|nr:hypothetical protein [Deltaproteobacteria bacterium]
MCGEKAVGNYANAEAFVFYNEALGVLGKMSDDAGNRKKELDIIKSMAPAMFKLNYPENSLSILEKGERLSIELQDKMGLAELYGHISFFYSFRGDQLKAIQYTENTYKQALQVENINSMAQTVYSLFSTYLAFGEYFKIVNAASEVIRLLKKVEKEWEFFSGVHLYSLVLSFWGFSKAMLGDFNAGLDLIKKRPRYVFED